MIRTVEHNHYDQDLRLRHTAVTVITPFSVLACLRQSSSTEHGVKNFADSSAITNISVNLSSVSIPIMVLVCNLTLKI